VNSKTENQKTFEGSSRARKGKITAEDDNWRDQKERGLLTSYFNQRAARALASSRASWDGFKHDSNGIQAIFWGWSRHYLRNQLQFTS